MKDWNMLAKGTGLEIPGQDLARLETPLKALETAFRPLVKQLEPQMEPTGTFDAGEENL